MFTQEKLITTYINSIMSSEVGQDSFFDCPVIYSENAEGFQEYAYVSKPYTIITDEIPVGIEFNGELILFKDIMFCLESR